MSRLLDALRLVEQNAATPSHPKGCVAVTGWDDRADGIHWIIRVNTCEHDHPDTQAALFAQYDDQGWINLDAAPANDGEAES